jgi:alkaline phosphatase D
MEVEAGEPGEVAAGRTVTLVKPRRKGRGFDPASQEDGEAARRYEGQACRFFLLIVLVNFNVSTSHRVVFGSCNNAEKGNIWGIIEKQARPDSLILLGDSMYADTRRGWRFQASNATNLSHQWGLLANNEEFVSLVDSMGGMQKGVQATYDDHDYGLNNGDKTLALRNLSQQLFFDFLQVPNDSARRQRSGVYSSRTKTLQFENFRTFTYKVVLLDSRSNKDPVGSPEGDFLGPEQWSWLEEELADSEPDFFLLGSSIQVLPTDKFLEETWNEFPKQRARLLNLITSAPSKVVIISGDIHTGEILQAKCKCPEGRDFRLLEVTSSGLSHTFTKTILSTPSSQQSTTSEKSKGTLFEFMYDMYTATGVSHSREFFFADHFKGLHYAVIDFKPDSDLTLQISFKIVDLEGRVVMSREVLVDAKQNSNQDHVDKCTCEPFWGPAPLWRISLARWALLLIPLGLPLTLFIFIISQLLFSKRITQKTKSH